LDREPLLLIRVGVEIDLDGKHNAWALDFPGCFSYGADRSEALLKLPISILNFDYWVRTKTEQPWYQLGSLDFHVEETFQVEQISYKGEPYTINAFFEDDKRPLTAEVVQIYSQIFEWQHQELMAGVETLDEGTLNQIQPGERWSILGILRHLAFAELWYLHCLGIDVPALPPTIDSITAIDESHRLVQELFPSLVEKELLTEYAQEKWTPRKFARRLLWHRRDHIDHIRHLVGVI
jgi:hypothetical protein